MNKIALKAVGKFWLFFLPIFGVAICFAILMCFILMLNRFVGAGLLLGLLVSLLSYLTYKENL